MNHPLTTDIAVLRSSTLVFPLTSTRKPDRQETHEEALAQDPDYRTAEPADTESSAEIVSNMTLPEAISPHAALFMSRSIHPPVRAASKVLARPDIPTTGP